MTARRVSSPSSGGILYVVATPIGNLEDITLRALRILKEVAVVAAEDTRRTGNLLRHFGIETRLLSVHEHNEKQRGAKLIDRLAAGESIALVTDAGTPAISDPGAEVVRQVRDAGYLVVAVPGPSAVMAALSVAGVVTDRFAFGGFPPVRSKDRKKWWAWAAAIPDYPVVLFEAPHRVHATLREAEIYLGKRPIMAARELTKIHEEVVVGSATQLLQRFRAPMGEFVLVLLPNETSTMPDQAVSDADILAIFGQTTEHSATSRREAVKRTAEAVGLSPNQVYAALERAGKLVE